MPRRRDQHPQASQHPQRGGHTKRSKKFSPLPGKISKSLRRLGDNFNFGLYFNKWLQVIEKETSFDYEFQSQGQAKNVLKNYAKVRSNLKDLLGQKHQEIDALVKAFEKLGYTPLVNKTCDLRTPLIIGLGNAHPTDRGFTFHWTLGLPYIPAESIKGVVRLAYLVEKAQKDPDFFENWAREDEEFWKYLAKPFGRAEKENGAERGKVIFLDAFPVEVPDLTLEITTCHYSGYYGGKRGPTEDQDPNPLPFLAVRPGVKFRFVVLASKELKDKEEEALRKAFVAALTDYGFGAKTALGHGRFKP